MSILQPFCDYLNITTPLDVGSLLVDQCLDVFGQGRLDATSSLGVWRVGSGTFTSRRRGQVQIFSASGGVLEELRARGTYGEYLSVFAGEPHRVSTMHVTMDRPVDAPTVLRELYRRVRDGELRLTNKRIARDQVREFVRPGWVDGRRTGTLYLGSRKADVWAKVYDKRNELLDVAITAHGKGADVVSLNDPGPLTRYEICLGRHVGATLRDAMSPEAAFWHFAVPGLLPAAACRGAAPKWAPHAAGFEVKPREPDPMRQLVLLLETSQELRRAVRLADRVGPGTRDWLAHKVRTLPAEPLPA